MPIAGVLEEIVHLLPCKSIQVRVDGLAVFPDLEVEMESRALTCVADLPDGLASGHDG